MTNFNIYQERKRKKYRVQQHLIMISRIYTELLFFSLIKKKIIVIETKKKLFVGVWWLVTV